jgi:hypothetical protein
MNEGINEWQSDTWSNWHVTVSVKWFVDTFAVSYSLWIWRKSLKENFSSVLQNISCNNVHSHFLFVVSCYSFNKSWRNTWSQDVLPQIGKVGVRFGICTPPH